MKPIGAEHLFDDSKIVFYFAAEERVDFRELVRELAAELHTASTCARSAFVTRRA